jgi:phosphatidylglycerol lysyltransferase
MTIEDEDQQRRPPSPVKRIFNVALTVVLILGAGYLMRRALHDVEWLRLRDDLLSMPLSKILHAASWAAVSYGALTFYDFIGFRYLKRRINYGQAALSALLGYGISHTLGFSAVTGGAVRYRLYARWGLSALDVARVMGLAGISLLTGLFLGLWGQVPGWGMRGLGTLLILMVVAYLAAGFLHRRGPLRFLGMTLPLPRPGLACAQVLAGTSDWLAVASSLYVLLPSGSMLPFPEFAGVFVSAYMLGTISNVPGGLGVFDSLMLVSLSPSIPAETVLSCLLVYRGIYYLVPFTLSGLVFLGIEIRPGQRRDPRAAKPG